MTDRHALTDSQWERIVPHLPPVLGRPGVNDRLFLDGVLWIAKTGSPWRDMPAHLGAWAQVYQRFARWSEAGVFEKLFAHFAEDRDLEYLLIDSTIVRAHACAAGAKKNTANSL